MKTLRANGSRLKSDAGRPKKWVSQNLEKIIYDYERFNVGSKKGYEEAKKKLNNK